MPIQVLDQSTINQIAAGEVVERPASVVKELMENAIDAGATAITVEIRDGGIGFIRITDNGCGIDKKELPLAFLRHSTSKIRTAEDLLTVSSLGFRGEALSSIAAVSQVELITKTPESLTGSRYQIEGGKEKSLEEVGAPDGTTFISRNLFFNTPARRKFLKTAATEGAHVADLVEKIALSHPEISIRLIVNNQNKIHTSGNHNLKDIIYTIYGRELTANLIPLTLETEMFRVKGFIANPSVARGNRNYESYFINGRYIKSGLISKAIEDGYKSYMMQHKYPFTMLHISVEPEFIDVNVHPSKMELRFKDGEEIYRVLSYGIREVLSGRELIPEATIAKEPEISEASLEKPLAETAAEKAPHRAPEPFERKRMELSAGAGRAMRLSDAVTNGAVLKEQQSEYAKAKATGLIKKTPEARKPQELPRPQEPAAQPMPSRPQEPAASSVPPRPQEPAAQPMPPIQKEPAAQPMPPIQKEPAAQPMPSRSQEPAASSVPQKTTAYSQLEMFDGRLLSEKAREEHRIIGQVFDTYWLVEYRDNLYIIDQHAAHEKVLFEKTYATLSSREYTSQYISPPLIVTLSMQEEERLKKHLSVFQELGFEIEPFGGREYAIYAVPDNLFSLAKKELFTELLDNLSDVSDGQSTESIYDRIASMSCKAAVKGNHRLSEREAHELIGDLLKLENPYACPHGRPTIISISKYEMEKKFKRIL